MAILKKIEIINLQRNKPGLANVQFFSILGSMNTKNRTKINHLISQWPRGAVFTQAYLTQIGYYRDLTKAYKRTHWIQPIGNGAFKLFNDRVDWYGGLYTLQKQLRLSIHTGGKTALELKGLAHYVQPQERACFLFGKAGEKLPKWFSDYDWGVSIVYKATNLLPSTPLSSFSEFHHKEFSINISSPERAALEMLYYVPAKQGYDEAMKIMENLVALRPAIVQTLLEQCNSVKVKRLFLYMAEKLDHSWFSQLKLKRIDLGRGKRVIIENASLDKKYQITVPEVQSL
jgi:hypothetical protein